MKKIAQIFFLLLIFSEQGKAQCGLTANFSYSVSASETSVSFSVTSVGTNSNAIYNWYFGDGTSDTTMFLNISHTYSSNGVYTATLVLMQLVNEQWCSSSAVQSITVNVCTLLAHLSHTLNTEGIAYFESTSTGTNPYTNYYWDFGDGNYSAGSPSAIHTYSNNGTHYVKLKIIDGLFPACHDSLLQAINVTFVTTNIDELKDERIEFKVYPNPASEVINVELEKANGNTDIRVIDILGKIVIQHSSFNMYSSIDISELQNGIYFLNVRLDNKTFTKKIIVNKN